MTEPSESSEELTKLHPDHIKVTRIVSAIWMLVLAIPCAVIEFALYSTGDSPIPNGPFIGLWLAFAIYIVTFLPHRRYVNRGYHMGADRIRIVRGYLFYSDTIVPFGRIQHIDLDQGPIQRRYDLATLTVHTAGNHNSTVSLPGLLHEDAAAMREGIRAHIKRDAI
jgi:uncharacterized protein